MRGGAAPSHQPLPGAAALRAVRNAKAKEKEAQEALLQQQAMQSPPPALTAQDAATQLEDYVMGDYPANPEDPPIDPSLMDQD